MKNLKVPPIAKWISLALLVLFILTYPAVELTSTVSFCNSCHEIKPAVESWKTSEHGIVEGKVLATCRDCHIPSWTNPFNVLIVKASHGAKDLYHHFFSKEEIKKEDFYFAMKYKTIKSTPNDRCTVCHEKVLNPGEDIIKTDYLQVCSLHTSEEAINLSCLMCHRNMGHSSYE